METQQPIYLLHSKGKIETQDFYIDQYFVQCLAEYSYYIESNKEAMVIDPMREPEPYMYLEIEFIEIRKTLQERGAKLKYIAETHLHADFVSGHYELAQKTGALVVYGPSATTSFTAKVCSDGGKIKIRVDHTPGHTKESSCFVLLTPTGKEYCAFTGDTLFLNEVGRPDLACNENITKEQLAGMLYDSLRNKVMKYPDECLVFPGHGAGSACGKSIGSGNYCTIGKQKISNYALQEMSRDQFIQKLASNIPLPPQYFFHAAALNKLCLPSAKEALLVALRPLNYNEFLASVNKSCRILDCRDDISDGIIPGAVYVRFGVQFAQWAGTLLKPTERIVLVAEKGNAEYSILRLIRIGYTNIEGYLTGGIEQFLKNGGKTKKVRIVKPKDFLEKSNNPQQHILLDVRKPGEQASGILPGATCIELIQLQNHQLPLDKTVHVYCATGGRARMSLTYLHNMKEVILTTVGAKDIAEQNGIALVKP